MRDDVPPPYAASPVSWLNGRPVPIDFGGPTDVPFEQFLPQWIDQPAIRRFHAIADRFADKVAVDDGTTRLTYRQVREAVAALAAAIVSATPEGGPIAAILDNTSAFPVAFLACLMTGRPIIPIDSSYPADRQQAILQECGAIAAILGDGLPPSPHLPDSLPLLRITAAGTPASGTKTLADAEPPVATAIDGSASDATATDATATNTTATDGTSIEFAAMDAPAGVIYTSGSTGQPKGVAFSQRQFLAGLAEYINACHIGHADRLMGLASLAGANAREALAALLTGATFHISDLRQSGIGAAFRTMMSARVTVLAFVPSALRNFAALPSRICPNSCAMASNCAARTVSIGAPPRGAWPPFRRRPAPHTLLGNGPGWRLAPRRRGRLRFRRRRLAGGAPPMRVCGAALRGRVFPACCHRHTRLNDVVDPGIARRPR
jgi:non-ribosomal peptide synthetase component F